jgi:cell division protein FtsW
MNSPRRGTPDFILLALTFLLVGFGTVMVYSSSSAVSGFMFNDSLYFTKKQLMWAGIGVAGMLFTMNIHYMKLKKLFIPFFMLILILLIAVLFSEEFNGAKSWIRIGNFGSLQPSEFAKLAIILYLAALIQKKGEKFRDFQKGLLPVLLIVAFMAGLIMLQPDLGTTIIFVFCSLVVIVVGGANLKHLFYIFGLLASIFAVFISIYLLVTDPKEYGYRMDRITSYLDPWAAHHQQDASYQLIQSLFAFGHGGLTGTGLGQSIQKLHYLPEAYNDFIFSIIGEEFGFIGASLFIFIFLGLLWRGLIIALRSPDIYGTLVGTGIVSMLGFQALINIGGVTGSIPITGVPLPFISYGGSSLLVSLLSIGILLSISRENNKVDAKNDRNAAV